MRDRVVQFPNRFRLTPVDGQPGVYDITLEPGEVTEWGTPYNKATQINDETAAALGLEGDSATVNNALQRAPLASYMAFCGNVNEDMLDAAFGKNNEGRVLGLGRQLAMYAWFKGSEYEFKELNKSINTTLDLEALLSMPPTFYEIFSSGFIVPLMLASPYAREKYEFYFGEEENVCYIASKLSGLDESMNISYASLISSQGNIDSILNSSEALDLLSSKSSFVNIARNNETFVKSFIRNENGLIALSAHISRWGPALNTNPWFLDAIASVPLRTWKSTSYAGEESNPRIEFDGPAYIIRIGSGRSNYTLYTRTFNGVHSVLGSGSTSENSDLWTRVTKDVNQLAADVRTWHSHPGVTGTPKGIEYKRLIDIV